MSSVPSIPSISPSLHLVKRSARLRTQPTFKPIDPNLTPFDIIHESTTNKEFIDDIPKNEYYKASRSDIPVKLYFCPRYIPAEFRTLLHIRGEKKFSINSAMLAAATYGLNRYVNSAEYKLVVEQYDRLQTLSQNREINHLDRLEALDSLNLRLSSNDLGTGFVVHQFRCPEHIHEKLTRPCSIIPVSMSKFILRFIMDALREQRSVQYPYKIEMETLVDNELYPQTQRTGDKLKRILDWVEGRTEGRRD